jgi:hypothetical protein
MKVPWRRLPIIRSIRATRRQSAPALEFKPADLNVGSLFDEEVRLALTIHVKRIESAPVAAVLCRCAGLLRCGAVRRELPVDFLKFCHRSFSFCSKSPWLPKAAPLIVQIAELILERTHLDQEGVLSCGPKCGVAMAVSVDLADAGLHRRNLGPYRPDFIVQLLLIGHGGSPG